ncbi:hypothetical protein GF325_16325 [Candidatus Bathyarchaeota archaeon]|nr:hypothetical protein [Candidatus Bathyarchaeota archaeon]
MVNRNKGPWFVDLFAGCGGFSRGLLDAGWRHVAANEIWDPAAETYERNVSENVIRGDIRDESVFKELVDAARGKTPLVVVGGPPCQAFSIAGNRNPVDPRGHLWKRFSAYIDATSPVAFIMENVKGLVSMKHIDENIDEQIRNKIQEAARKMQRFKDLKRFKRQRELEEEEIQEFQVLKEFQEDARREVKKHLVPLLPRIIESLATAGKGYEIQHLVLNAAHYGVPQFRKRIFIIGLRTDIYEKISAEYGGSCIFHPLPTHARFENGKPVPPRNFDGHIDIGNLKPFTVVKDAIGDLTRKPENCLPNHVFMKSKPSFIQKIARTSPGSSVYPHYRDAWYRLIANEPARTVKENHGGVHCHPEIPRTLTPRELARLQAFNDSFVFEGRKSHVLVQIGNAVPPLLAKILGKRVGNLVTQAYS